MCTDQMKGECVAERGMCKRAGKRLSDVRVDFWATIGRHLSCIALHTTPASQMAASKRGTVRRLENEQPEEAGSGGSSSAEVRERVVVARALPLVLASLSSPPRRRCSAT